MPAAKSSVKAKKGQVSVAKALKSEAKKQGSDKKGVKARKNGDKVRGKRARPPGGWMQRAAKAGLNNGVKRDQVVALQSRSLKQRIRDTQRILALDTLPETVRLTKERVLQTLERELAEKECREREDQRRGEEDRREGRRVKNKKRELKRMKLKANVQFFEKRKTIRMLKHSIRAFYEATSDATRTEFFDLIKTQRRDLNYVHHFPDGGPYVSLFPGTRTTSEWALKKKATVWADISERVIEGILDDKTEDFIDIIIQKTVTACQQAIKDTTLRVPHFPAFDAESISYLSHFEIEEYASTGTKPSSERASLEEKAKIGARMKAVGVNSMNTSPMSADPSSAAVEESGGGEAAAVKTSELERTCAELQNGNVESPAKKAKCAVSVSKRVKVKKMKRATAKVVVRGVKASGGGGGGLKRSPRRKRTAAVRYLAAVDQEGAGEEDPAIKMEDDFFLPSH